MGKGISERKYLIIIIILWFICIQTTFANIAHGLDSKIDSICNIADKCPTDTGKFNLLVNFYWQNRAYDTDLLKEIGLKAFGVIKSSSNLKYLSDGFDLRAVLYNDEYKPDSSLVLFLKALHISQKIGYRHRTKWCLYNIGITHLLSEENDSAIFYFKKLLEFEKNQPVNKSFAEKALYGIIEIYSKINKPDSAVAYMMKLHEFRQKSADRNIINQSLKQAEMSNDTEALSKSYFQIGLLFFKQKKYGSALLYFNRALEINKSIDAILKTTVLVSISEIYLHQGNDSSALRYAKQAMQISKETNNKTLEAYSYNSLGNVYKHKNEYERAINCYKATTYDFCDTCPPIEKHNATISIGDCFLELNNREKALEYYIKSFSSENEILCNMQLAISNLKLGNYYRYTDRSTAYKYYQKAYSYINDGIYYKISKTISDSLCSFHLEDGDYKKAFAYKSFSSRMADSINKYMQEAALAEWETKFEFERINNENSKKLAQQEIQRNGAFIISVLLIIIVLVILINYRRKQKDNKLLISQKEEIKNVSRQLHESDQAKLTIFTNISHELRTPLTLILSPLQKLLKEEKNEKLKQTYSLIIRNSYTLQSLIEKLLDVAKIHKTGLSIIRQLHDLGDQIKVLASMFDSLAEEKNIDFSISITPDDLIFNYDAQRMEQIINNLLSNAFKFVHANGKISITVIRQNETAVIKVFDTGIGITENNLQKVFDRFYQTDTTQTQHIGGSGIGLSLVKELVELHQGNVYATSDIGKWTEFTVIIPIIKSESEAKPQKYLPSTAMDISPLHKNTKSNVKTQKHKETILLVEDNEDLRAYLSSSLSEKYNVLEARNGVEGIVFAKKEIPDIIISDIMMPQADGFQLTSKIRKQIETCHIPIILLTAKAQHNSKIEGLERGANDYIYKPFDEEEILLKVKNILLNRQKLQDKFQTQTLACPSSVNEKSMDDKFIIKLVSIIEQDISNTELNVNFLAKNICLSRQQLYRKLKAITGKTPREFIRSIRLKRAAQLIEQNTGSIGEIAYRAGFDNLSYFSKRFKEEFGKLPSEYGKVEI